MHSACDAPRSRVASSHSIGASSPRVPTVKIIAHHSAGLVVPLYTLLPSLAALLSGHPGCCTLHSLAPFILLHSSSNPVPVVCLLCGSCPSQYCCVFLLLRQTARTSYACSTRQQHVATFLLLRATSSPRAGLSQWSCAVAHPTGYL